MFGPAPYFFVFVLVIFLSLFPVRWYFIIIGIHLAIFVLASIAGLTFPSWITNPYKTNNEIFINILDSVIAISFLILLCIYVIRKSYEQERKINLEQKAMLEISNQQKSRFFINLAHEIKTPLTLLENYLEKYITKKGEEDELLIMRRNIQKLRRDMLDYLNYENLERGSICFDKQDVIDLAKFLDEKIKLFLPFANKKLLTVKQNIEPLLFIKFNLQAIDQVLNNLLENSAKYTPNNGNIDISLKKEACTIVLTVQNSGDFIMPDQLIHLFDPFYQLSHEKLNAQGIGMGLYTIKKILDSEGSTINVESTKDTGVVFQINFPVCDELNDYAEAEFKISEPDIKYFSGEVSDSTYQTNRKILLLVEDHNDLLLFLRDELCESYNIYVAANGKKAIQKLDKIPLPDLIISDIMMDEMDGYELLQKTLMDERFNHIPFIFLTARSNTDEKITGLGHGAFDFITKPFSIDELRLKIRNILDYHERLTKVAVCQLKEQFSISMAENIEKINARTFGENTSRYNLTAREIDILVQLKKGLKYEDIGEQLNISEYTVIRHVQNIYRKTSSTAKVELLQKMYSA
jgi:signal transduction histidine kinase/DNA-binding NarL/FixJ family response regulator